jgi:hypothetical protein
MSRASTRTAAGSGKNSTRPPSPQAKQARDSRKAAEPISQVTIKMRESLHRELARNAFNSGMTMRGYIMRALKQNGLDVTEADLIDGRKKHTDH